MDSAEKVIESGVAIPTIFREAELLWVGEPLSLAVTVKTEVPFEVDVPEITPLVEIERPPGN